jgi:hypothetical protein
MKEPSSDEVKPETKLEVKPEATKPAANPVVKLPLKRKGKEINLKGMAKKAPKIQTNAESSEDTMIII